MRSKNKWEAQVAFGNEYNEARQKAKAAIIALRMEMIRYSKDGNVEPAMPAEQCSAEHNSGRLTSQQWHAMERERQECDVCAARQSAYWRLETWKKTRGETLNKLRYALKDYKHARKMYWASGGHTELGADRFT
jgi:hypothetical protein